MFLVEELGTSFDEYNGVCSSGNIEIVPPADQEFVCYTNFDCSIDVGVFSLSRECVDEPDFSFFFSDVDETSSLSLYLEIADQSSNYL